MVFSTAVRAQAPQKGEMKPKFLPSNPPGPPPFALDDVLRGASANEKIPVIVRFQSPLAEAEYAQLEARIGAFKPKYKYNIIPGMAVELNKGQINALSRIPIVRSIDYNNRVYAYLDTATHWFGVDDAVSLPGGATGDGIAIAVIDTGIDDSHVDLDGEKVIGWADFVNYELDPTEGEPYDDHGHGTHVSSIAAGTGAGNSAYAGVAPDARLVGVKVLDGTGSGWWDDVVAGIDWCVASKTSFSHEIRVMNLSLGGTGSSDGTDPVSEACNNAVEAGIVVVAAAGNSGPARYTISTPAAAADAITVGAMADVGEGGFFQAYFSSRGPTADERIKPDVSAPGYNIIAAWAGSGSDYTGKSGTSMAAPFVAGVAALILEKSNLSPSQVKSQIMDAAQDWGLAGADIPRMREDMVWDEPWLLWYITETTEDAEVRNRAYKQWLTPALAYAKAGFYGAQELALTGTLQEIKITGRKTGKCVIAFEATKDPQFLEAALQFIEQAADVVRKTATRSRIPEPIRVAHLVASSFVPD